MIYKDDNAVKFHLALADNTPVPNAFEIYTLFVMSRPLSKQWTFCFGMCSVAADPKPEAFLERIFK